jgi:hypothetical protein
VPILFSYGSLQREDVQLTAFGRRLGGWADELLGFSLVPAGAHSPHANLAPSAPGRVSGRAFEVTQAELAAADEYEHRDAYTRIAGRLASNQETWVYISRTST